MPWGGKFTDAVDLKRAVAAATFGDNTKKFRAELAKAVEAAHEHVLESLSEADASKRVKEVKEAMSNLGRRAGELGDVHGDADAEVNRLQLKAQATTYKMKIEASRSAGKVDLQNEMAALEASHAAMLAQQVELAKAGGSTELAERRAQVEALTEELEGTKGELNKMTELVTMLNATKAEQTSEFEKQLLEASDAREQQGASMQSEIAQLTMQLRVAEDSRDILEKNLREEVSRKVEYARREMAAGMERAVKASKEEIERLKAVVSQHEAAVVEAETRVERGADELAQVRAQMERREVRTAELESQVALGDQAYEIKTEQLRRDLMGSREETRRAHDAVSVVKAEANSLIQAKEAAQRRLAESLSKTMSDIARATRASQDECQRQLGMMNMRVKAELDAVRAGEREKAQEQLDRLLDELAVSEEKAAKLIDQIKEMENQHKQVHQMAQRLNALRADEKSMREKLSVAAREVNMPLHEGLRLPEQFSAVINAYQKVHSDVALITASLDQAMAEAELNSQAHADLSGKLTVLLSAYQALRNESVSMRKGLDWALSSVSLKTGESASLEKKLKALIEQFKIIGSSENTMRDALRRQHNSLHTAFHRVKSVEGELARAHGAHAEEREALVSSALHALSQLRTHLGAVHALRPEVSRPLDEALMVKNLAHGDGMMMMGVPPSPPSTATRAQIEATMARMAETAGALVTGVTGGALSPVKLGASLSHAQLRSSRAALQTPWSPGANPGTYFPGGYMDATSTMGPPMGVAADWQPAMARPMTLPKKGSGGLRPITSSLSASSLATIQPGVLRVAQPGSAPRRDRIGTAPGGGYESRLGLPSPTRDIGSPPPPVPFLL